MPKSKVRYGNLTIDQVSELCSSQIECASCPIGWNCSRVTPVPANWHTDVNIVLQKKMIDKNN